MLLVLSFFSFSIGVPPPSGPGKVPGPASGVRSAPPWEGLGAGPRAPFASASPVHAVKAPPRPCVGKASGRARRSKRVRENRVGAVR